MTYKNVFITGASRGIGAAIARDLVAQGYVVHGTARNKGNIEQPVQEVVYHSLDLSEPVIPDNILAEIGNADILINNAGISQVGALVDVPEAAFDSVMQVNFHGPVKTCRAFLQAKSVSNTGGLIINIGSLVTQFPLPYYTAYGASKSALLAFSLALSYEAEAIGVNVVMIDPHDIKTTIKPTSFTGKNETWKTGTERMAASVKEHMAAASDTAVVVQTINSAIASKNPKPYYSSGKNGNWLLLARKLLSTRQLLKRIRKNYKL